MSRGALPPISIQPLVDGDPRQFGQFRTIGRLGSGGMGEAFLAESPDAWVVVKATRIGGPDTRELAARMAREVEAMQRVDSPLVARVIDAELDAERPWFAVEFIPGLSLAQRMSQFGHLDPRELHSFALGLARCIEAVHAAGVVHRDLKPDNVVLDSAGPRLIDFGTAEVSEGTELTTIGNLVGTMLWMAPEQVSGGQATPAVDVHAWGLMVVHAASGAIPFAAESTVATMYRALHEVPAVPATVPDPLATLVARALSKDPAQRPTAPELVRELGEAEVFVAGPGSTPLSGVHSTTVPAAGSSGHAVGRGTTDYRGSRPTDPRPFPNPAAAGTPMPNAAHPASALPGPTARPTAQRRRQSLVVLLVAVSLVALIVPGGWWFMTRDDAAATSDSTTPVQVVMSDGPDAQITRVSVGDTSSCVVADNGRAYCWGANDSGQLGSPGDQSSEPRQVDRTGVLKDKRIVRVSVGAEHACALDDDGRAYCWGANDEGQLGTEGVDSSDVPVEVSTQGVLAGKSLVLINAAADTTCALDDAGRLYCWGANGSGQFGNGTTTGSSLPVSVDTTGALSDRLIRRFAVGETHTCAVDTSGTAYCWGANDKGQLGTGTTQPSLVPLPVAPPPGVASYSFASISVGGSTTCGWGKDGSVACWGQGDAGQLGTGSLLDSSSPQWVVFRRDLDAGAIDTLNVGGATVCAASTHGRAFCWGSNSEGQLGDGSHEDSPVPVPVAVVEGEDEPDLPDFGRMGSGAGSSCAVGTDGTAWCWGTNADGRLGAGLAS